MTPASDANRSGQRPVGRSAAGKSGTTRHPVSKDPATKNLASKNSASKNPATKNSASKNPTTKQPPTKRRAVSGGGIAVEVAPDRLVGWVNRFAGRNDGLASVTTDGAVVRISGGDGTEAVLEVPFGPMVVGDLEPIEALLDHLADRGALGVILVRGGAHSVGVVRDGQVLSSSTDRAYLQGRTAAGGWSQQRFARRRENQRAASYESAASTVARMMVPVLTSLQGLVLGGDRRGLTDVLADDRLAVLADLPRRIFGDIAEPRRVILDEIAARSLMVEITVRPTTS